MYIRESRSKRGDTVHRTYQIAESFRDENGISRQRTLLHLGPADKFIKKDIDTLLNGLLRIKGITLEGLESSADEVKSFGQIWGLLHLWKELKISNAITRLKKKTKVEYDLEAHIKSLIFNRLDDPSSKLALLSWLETVHIPGIKSGDIRYEYLLRAMDFLITNKQELEDIISHRLLDLFNHDLKLCFYDLTSTYFEADKSITDDDIRRNGYSRDHRSDREQIVIGVVMTGDGLPLAHYTFSGNRSDSTTVQEVMSDIRNRFGVEKITLVADKGMVSGTNIKFLVESGFPFILGESPRQSTVAREVIKQAAKDRLANSPDGLSYIYETEQIKQCQIKEELSSGKIKQSTYKVNLRYVACYNPQMAIKKYHTRTKRITDMLMEVEQIQFKSINLEDQYSQILSILSRKRLSRFFSVSISSGETVLKRNDEELQFEQECDGWFLTISKEVALGKESIIAKYKDLKYIEHGFFELKHSLQLRPNHHWTPRRIKAHVMVCFMAFQIAVLFEKRLSDIKMTWEKAMQSLKRIAVIKWDRGDYTRNALVKVKPEQLEIFKAIGSVKPTTTSL